MRIYRKKEHIEYCLKASYAGDTLFSNVMLLNSSLPELDFDDVDTKVEFLGRRIGLPLMINAITGGIEFANEINISLAKLSDKFDIPMAVGSQTIAVGDCDAMKCFRIVREIAPKSLIIGNINAFVEPKDAKELVRCIDADAMQIHLNPAQELSMSEGDRCFKGVYDRLARLVDVLGVPVIIKEVGFGISAEVFRKLQSLGVEYIDISGSGGTNFIEVEDFRNPQIDFSDMYDWGIPTALSVYDCAKVADSSKIIASGGIKDALDIAKALRLGADMTAMSGEFLKYVVHGGYESAESFLRSIEYKLRMILVLTGSADVSSLKNCDARVCGRLKELMQEDSKLI